MEPDTAIDGVRTYRHPVTFARRRLIAALGQSWYARLKPTVIVHPAARLYIISDLQRQVADLISIY